VARVLLRIGIGALVTLVVLVGIVLGAGCCAFSAPRYQGPKSDHFDGEEFINPGRKVEQGFGAFWKWTLNRDQGPWRAWTDATPGAPPPRRVPEGALRVTWVNHATTLIQLDGVNILTDPIWSDRASPVGFAGPKRVRPPGIRFEDLPPIDVALVSHNHYDHCDIDTLKRLKDASAPKLFSGLGNAQLFAREGVGASRDLDWWESVQLPNGVKLTAVPVQHFSGRGLCDRMKNLWAGFVLEGRGGRVFFAGDTGYGPHFAQIRERIGPPDLAILPIGAFRPEWFMGPVHVTPDEAVQAHKDLGAKVSVPMHYGTFLLADDGQDEPLERLCAAITREGLRDDEFRVLDFGEGIDVGPSKNQACDVPQTPDDAREQLKLLSIFHYIYAVMTAGFSCLGLLYAGAGMMFLRLPFKDGKGEPPPPELGWIFAIFGGFFVLFFLVWAVGIFFAARSLARTERWTYCVVVAALNCASFPIGTALGVFTILVLAKPEVKQLFPPAQTDRAQSSG
jgi:L-ascorbate metabolism protein UlaG (beta-lactamase superfamily)